MACESKGPQSHNSLPDQRADEHHYEQPKAENNDGPIENNEKSFLEEYECDTFPHWKGYVLIHNEKGYGLLNPQSEIVYSPNWWRIYEFNSSSGDMYLMLVIQEGEGENASWRRGLGDFNGNIIMPVIYTYIHSAEYRDLCVVEQGCGSKGLFSIPLKREIIPCQFKRFCFLSDYILAQRTSLNTIINNSKYVIFDYNGNKMIACESEEEAHEWFSDHDVYAPSDFDYVY